MAKRRLSAWWLLLPLIALVAGAWWYFQRGGDKTDKYITAPVERGSIEETVSAIGALQPLQYVDVGTKVTGQLKTLHVAIGDVVKEGQLVAEIDPTIFASRVEATRATIRNLSAQLDERIAQQRLAQQQHARNKKLFASDAVSEEVLQQSAAAQEQAAAQVVSLKAQIAQNESQLKADEANLRYTKIHAPMSGTVVSVTARQGQTLVSSQTAPTILRVADLSTMTVWVQVSEADVPKIRLGMPVYFNTLGLTERRWNSKVRQILPTPETVNNVILYNVLFDVANPDQVLKPQMSAQAYFLLARADDVLMVPSAALQPLPKAGKDKRGDKAGSQASVGGKDASHAEGKGAADKAEGVKPKERKQIVRVLKDGRIEPREVSVGITTRLHAQVLSGLAEGEEVVVGTSTAKDKDKPSRGLPTPGRPF
jgi:macrolide-specific efflux system membrane fusion protein